MLPSPFEGRVVGSLIPSAAGFDWSLPGEEGLACWLLVPQPARRAAAINAAVAAGAILREKGTDISCLGEC